MWACEVESLSKHTGFRVTVLREGRPASTAELMAGLGADRTARAALSSCLASIPFEAFFWEVAPMSTRTWQRPFECVVLPAPGLARSGPDALAFAEHFSPTKSVVEFKNLGGDATLIVPCPRAPASVYPHLAVFLRQAPPEQCDELFRALGHTASELLNDTPFWLSTSGSGVAWLHVRFDQRPKYYQYKPYATGLDQRF